MKILVVNDDGIEAEGIKRLAKMAVQLGEVWVVAPKNQCSAMSHRITVFGAIDVSKEEFPVDGVKAFSITGTPADCVKVGLKYFLPEKPDVVFSGINHGFNVGTDILYSGTVGAAMEALLNGVPAIAFSSESNYVYDLVEEHLLGITKELLSRNIQMNEIWNVNIPGCKVTECRGILEDCLPAQKPFYLDHYEKTDTENGDFQLVACSILAPKAREGTDMRAVQENYISIGKIKNAILMVPKE